MVNDMENDFEIVTPRLILRTPRIEDAQELNAAMNDVWHDLQLWMSWAHDGEETMEATIRYLEGVQERVAQGHVPLNAYCRTTGRFAVATGLNYDGNTYETGYWVAKDFLGKGYATEAANAALRYAFNAIGADAVYINFFEGNEKSRRIIEKLGFTALEVRSKSHARCLDGVMMNDHRYVMTDPAVLPELHVEWRQRCS